MPTTVIVSACSVVILLPRTLRRFASDDESDRGLLANERRSSLGEPSWQRGGIMTYEQSRVCPHCGKEISARATRCKYCLEQVTAIPPEPLPSRSPIETARVEVASEPAVS